MACSDIEPLASLAGEAAVKFDPGNPEEIAAAMERIATDEDLRARLAAAGPEQAAKYSWERAARATLEALVR